MVSALSARGTCLLMGAESPFDMTPECLYSGSRLSQDPDSFKMCSEAGCDGQPRTWLFVRVANDDNNLVAGARPCQRGGPSGGHLPSAVWRLLPARAARGSGDSGRRHHPARQQFHHHHSRARAGHRVDGPAVAEAGSLPRTEGGGRSSPRWPPSLLVKQARSGCAPNAHHAI